jgi:trehalose/maltose hydrolase-like predicted phosphorylase
MRWAHRSDVRRSMLGAAAQDMSTNDITLLRAITTHGPVRVSDLAAWHAGGVCAEVGHLELAHDYAWEAALVDLRDLYNNKREGLHMASLAGAWSAIVEGFGGLREHGSVLAVAPRRGTASSVMPPT